MRPEGRGETDSLYFEYPYFPPPEKLVHQKDELVKVAIVGAGPVGMTAALALAKEGIACVLFDNKATFNDGSRAICIARPSFYIFERLGIADAFLKKSLGWTTGRTFYRGKQILEFQMPDSEDEKFRPMYNLQQQYIEQFLWDEIAENDLIETRWQSFVKDIEVDGNFVNLTVSDPNGTYALKTEWVLACDGARSRIREKCGLRLKGDNLEGRYVIADIQMDHDYPTIRRALFDPDCRRDGTVLIHRQPDNIWRIDYQLTDDETSEKALDEKTVRESVQSVLDEIGFADNWELEWWSVYSANTLALDDYRDNRVFFVGDSAHIVPIFGVRGLNNGLADAANIGWKLGWVINQKAAPELLDSYTPERRGATLDVFANASKSARFMTPSTHGWQLMRDAALSLALDHPFFSSLANPRQMTATTYVDSPAIALQAGNFSKGPEVGSVLQDIALVDGFLSDRLGAGFTIICFNKTFKTKADIALGKELDVTVVNLMHPSRVSSQYDAKSSTVYLVRPDMYVAGRWQDADINKVIDTYRRITFQ